jgi:hypothetical protein
LKKRSTLLQNSKVAGLDPGACQLSAEAKYKTIAKLNSSDVKGSLKSFSNAFFFVFPIKKSYDATIHSSIGHHLPSPNG